MKTYHHHRAMISATPERTERLRLLIAELEHERSRCNGPRRRRLRQQIDELELELRRDALISERSGTRLHAGHNVPGRFLRVTR